MHAFIPVLILVVALGILGAFLMIKNCKGGISKYSNIVLVGGTLEQIATVGNASQTAPGMLCLQKEVQIRIKVTSAAVRVKRGGDGDIVVVKANFPSSWETDNGHITQIGKAGEHLLSGEVNVRFFHPFGRQSQPIDRGRVEITPDGQILVDKRVIKHAFEDDELEVTIPDDFCGSLSVMNEGVGDVSIDEWNGGNLLLESSGGGDFSCGDLNALQSLTIEVAGVGSINLGRVETDSFSGKIDAGDFEATSLKAKSLWMQASGMGDISCDEIEVEQGELNLAGDSNCNVSVSELRATRELKILSVGTGDVAIDAIRGGRFHLVFWSNSNFNGDIVEADVFSFESDGTGDFNASVVAAVHHLLFAMSPESKCNVYAKAFDSTVIEVRSLGKGDVDVDAISGGDFAGRFESMSNLEVDDDIELSGKFALQMLGTGDASLPDIYVDAAEIVSLENACIDIAWIKGRAVFVRNAGSGYTEIESGEIDDLELVSTDSGDIKACGTFAAVRTTRSSSGAITIS